MLSSYRIDACRCVSVMGRIRHDQHKEICVSPTKMAGAGLTNTVDPAALKFCGGTNKPPLFQDPLGPLGVSGRPEWGIGRPTANRRERLLKDRERPTGCAKFLTFRWKRAEQGCQRFYRRR